MKIPEVRWQTVASLLLCVLVLASVSQARILGPDTVVAKGVVTDVDLQLKTVSIDGQPYNLEDNPIALDQLRSQSIRILEEVEITYQKTDKGDKLIFFKKQSETLK
jgi:hypothetical protein